MNYNIIVCKDICYGIGKEGGIPWDSPVDRKIFYDVTTRNFGSGNLNIMVMGRKTWESLPTQARPFKKRITFVLSRSMTEQQLKEGSSNDGEVYIISSFNGIAEKLKQFEEQKRGVGEVFICGGGELYREAFEKETVKRIYLSTIHRKYDCDVTFPQLDYYSDKRYNVKYVFLKNDICGNLEFMIYSSIKERENNEEQQYLDILQDLINFGERKMTRNGYTLSLFFRTMEFNLGTSFPLYTTKKISFEKIVSELLFFLSGDTNTKHLEAQGNSIWKDNTSASFLSDHHLPYDEGDMGPMYGFQWRHFGATYEGCDADYQGKGIDQVVKCLDLIKNDPSSRRIVMTSFNVSDAEKGVLYPCHGIAIQFHVSNDNCLSCSVVIRSNDWCVGNPFNVASYALLVHFFVYAVNNDVTYAGPKLSVGKLLLSINDVHLYCNHLDNAMLQCTRIPFSFPTLKIKEKKEGATNLFPLAEDLILENYVHHPFLRYQMNP